MELHDLLESDAPLIKRQRVNILSLNHAVIEVMPERVEELQGVLKQALLALLDDDFNYSDHLLQTVSLVIENKINNLPG